jgi:tRNA nucleotidyltransferase/poly(A) polymerase
VRFIGDPATRIAEDHLRVLRFFRFHAQYGAGPLDPEGFSAAIRAQASLARLSRERIRTEILKLVAAPRAPEVVAELAGAGIIARVLGIVGEAGRLARAGGDPVRGLAAYAVLTREDAARLAEGLRLSNAEAARLDAYARALAGLRSPPDPLHEPDIRRLVAAEGAEALDDALRALAGEPRPVLTPDAADVARRFASGAEPIPALPLRGADLLARGVAPGPELGALLSKARELWLEGGCRTDLTERERLLRHIIPEPSR